MEWGGAAARGSAPPYPPVPGSLGPEVEELGGPNPPPSAPGVQTPSPSSLRPRGLGPAHSLNCSLVQGWDFFTMLCSVSVAQTCYPISEVC